MRSTLSRPFIVLALFSLVLCTVACKKDNQDTTVTILVAAKPVKARVLLSNVDTDHMNVLEEGSSIGWRPMHMGQIEGFDYEEGFEYVLTVRKYNIANPPADGSSVGYALIKIKSKVKV